MKTLSSPYKGWKIKKLPVIQSEKRKITDLFLSKERTVIGYWDNLSPKKKHSQQTIEKLPVGYVGSIVPKYNSAENWCLNILSSDCEWWVRKTE